jgi:NhaP-type Na+/H+ or K+/H+ antiporter
MDLALTIAVIGLLVFLAHVLTIFFGRTRIPDVLFLIAIGVCLGPVFDVITPAEFGVVGPVFTAITLIIILFEAGITIHLAVLRKTLIRTLILTILSFAGTMGAVGALSYYFTDLSLTMSLMLGAMVGSTSPAIIIPLIRQIKVQKETEAVLSLESAISDALSIIVVFAFLEAFKLGEIKFPSVAIHVVESFAVAIAFGLVCAFGWSIALNRMRNLKNAIFTTPAFVFIIFGVVELLGYSGYVAALSFGITLGNIELANFTFLKKYLPHEPISLNDTEKIFFSEVVFLLKTFFFVYVGLSFQRVDDTWVLYIGGIITVAIYVLRIFVTRVALSKSTHKADASIIAVMIPKGLAAAALASIPLQRGFAEGELVQNLTYAILLFSIILTSLLTFLLSKTKLSTVYGWVFSGFAAAPETSTEAQTSMSQNSTSDTKKS